MHTRLFFKFNQLSERSKKAARKSYMEGWKETHPDETEVFTDDIVSADGEALFNRRGEYLCQYDDEAEKRSIIEKHNPHPYRDPHSSPDYGMGSRH